MITHVAIQRSDGQVFSLARPFRHHHIFRKWPHDMKPFAPLTQGFLDSAEGFVDRERAAVLAFRESQTGEKLRILYSEDVW